MREHNYFVYIMSNDYDTVLYTGVTNNIERRVYEHKEHRIPGFTSRYNISKLLYYEYFENIEDAIVWEKRIKGWLRSKKEDLISEHNPEWKDLSADWF